MASAKLIKKKKRRVNLRGFVTCFFVFALLVFGMSRIFLKNYNYSLSVRASEAEQKVIELKKSVSTLENEINKLEDRDRVMAVAAKKGIKTNQDQVVMLEDEDKK